MATASPQLPNIHPILLRVSWSHYIDLQCLVAFDLKIEDFKPEHLGKMNFYLEILDSNVEKLHETPISYSPNNPNNY
jgi:YhcG PDDEXK nuclease domain